MTERLLSYRRLRFRRRLGASPQQSAEGLREMLEHKARADQEMARFDELGPETRATIRSTRFDALPSYVDRRYGGRHAEDDRVAEAVRRDDEQYSGAFGPRSPKGI